MVPRYGLLQFMSHNIEPKGNAVRVKGYGHKEGVFKAQEDYPKPVTLYNVGE